MDIETHCMEINRCNQRGGRMLSVVDLIRAGTLSLEAAAYCCAVIREGTSFLVGARPGGAGKTAVMCALLNFIPNETALRPTDNRWTLRKGLETPKPHTCFLAHEIGNGPYFAYLWDEEARLFFQLPGAGHMIATNLHTDTFEETRQQLCTINGVREEDFHRVGLHLYLNVIEEETAPIRRISSIIEIHSDGKPREIYRWNRKKDTFDRTSRSSQIPDSKIQDMKNLLSRLDREGVVRIADVRQAILSTNTEPAG